jgi:hypothetical protein
LKNEDFEFTTNASQGSTHFHFQKPKVPKSIYFEEEEKSQSKDHALLRKCNIDPNILEMIETLENQGLL